MKMGWTAAKDDNVHDITLIACVAAVDCACSQLITTLNLSCPDAIQHWISDFISLECVNIPFIHLKARLAIYPQRKPSYWSWCCTRSSHSWFSEKNQEALTYLHTWWSLCFSLRVGERSATDSNYNSDPFGCRLQLRQRFIHICWTKSKQ